MDILAGFEFASLAGEFEAFFSASYREPTFVGVKANELKAAAFCTMLGFAPTHGQGKSFRFITWHLCYFGNERAPLASELYREVPAT
jgi:hypothetical protein